MLPLAESRALGVARPDAGRMRCPTETLGEGERGRTAGKGRETATGGGVMSIRDKLISGPLGFGSAPLGNMFRNIPEEEAAATVDAAWQQGIRFYDTAPLYGAGLSEMRLGRALAKHKRGEYVLSSKVGRLILDEVETGPRQLGEKGNLFEFGRPNRMVYDYSTDGTLRLKPFDVRLHYTQRHRLPAAL